MGACLSTAPRRAAPPALTPVVDTEIGEAASDGSKVKQKSDDTAHARPPQPSLPSSSISFLTIDAKGRVTPSTAPTPAALASLTGIPERDVRLLLPPWPPIHSPSGTALAGPAVLARRGTAWVVGLEGVRGVVCTDRAVLLVGPALGGTGALDSGGRAPEASDPFVLDLAGRIARAPTTRPPTPFQTAALDAMVEAVVLALEARAAAVAADAAAAADALVAAVTGRGGGGSGWSSACCCCCCAAPTTASGPDYRSSTITRLRRVKGEVSDCEAAARRVAGALGRRKARRRGGGRGDDDDDDGEGGVAAVLAAGAARAAAAVSLGDRAASAARDAETAARMALRRRALACGGA